MMNELKPCPFCGGKVHIESYHSRWQGTTWNFKHTCKGGSGNDRRIVIYAGGFATEEEVIEAWNRRVEDA